MNFHLYNVQVVTFLNKVRITSINQLILSMKTYFYTNGKRGVVQIGTHILNVLYYFTEHDTIYCKVVGGDNNFKVGYEFFTHYKSLMENEMSKEMNEFLDKVDALCFEYGYEIHPTIHGWTGKTDENGKYKTIAIIGNDEIGEVIYIDGDGRGK